MFTPSHGLMKNTLKNSLVVSALLAMTSCGQSVPEQSADKKETVLEKPLQGQVTVSRLPVSEDPTLILGSEVYAGTCMGCHGLGIADSPKVTDLDAWAPRIAQGKDVLYQHALEGFFGAESAMMPARGGNESLTDEQVKAGVDFMVFHSQ